jgi:hypothetical protein
MVRAGFCGAPKSFEAGQFRRSVKDMNWDIDAPTQAAASNYPVQMAAVIPADQYPGRTFNSINWNHRVLQRDYWPQGAIVSSPQQIILTFQRQQYLQALALVVSWGTMWRRAGAIYGNNSLQNIQNTLAQCAESILATQSIAQAWMVLTHNLGWSAVITSKTLHFLCRALGFNHDPPVAIDNKVIRNRVWPVFCNGIPVGQRPQNWGGDAFGAYSRYMTAILEWSQVRNWTTTQLEVTLFDEYK